MLTKKRVLLILVLFYGHSMRAMYKAAATNDIVTLKKVLKKNDAINQPESKWGLTPLGYAIKHQHVAAAKFILKHGADPNRQSNTYRLTSPLSHVSLVASQKNSNVSALQAIAKELCKYGGDIDGKGKRSWDNSTPPLITAIEHKAPTGFLSFLIKKLGANPNAVERFNQKTPLMCAAGQGLLAAVKLLLGVGSKVCTKDINGHTALGYALNKGYKNKDQNRIMQILCCHAKSEPKFKNELQPLLASAMTSGNLFAVDMFVDLGASLHALSKYGASSLMSACSECNEEKVDYLLNAPVEVNQSNKWGDTALHVIASAPRTDDKLAFLHVNEREKRVTLSPRWESKNSVSIAHKLLNGGADRYVRNAKGFLPLDLAVFQNNLPMISLLLQNAGFAKYVETQKDSSIVHIATKLGHCKALSMLLDYGFCLETVNAHGDRPLHVATRSGHKDAVELLLKKGADVFALNDNKESAAKIATQNKMYDVLQLLIEEQDRQSDKLD